MKVTRSTVRICCFIFGPLVLLSYMYTLSKMEEPMALWGGIPENLRSVNVFCMFVAATGFLIMWRLFLYKWDVEVVESLNWPWKESGSGGNSRLLLGFLLIMIPSAFWIESTNFHISNDYSWTPFLVVGILILVSFGNILLGLLAWSAYREGIENSIWAVIGAGMLAIQVIINDAIWWSIKFPW